MDDTGPLAHLSEEDLKAAKARFAALFLKTPDAPFIAAQGVFNNTGQAIYAAYHWPRDPDVIAEQGRLLEHSDNGELNFLPSKADAAREAWKTVKEAVFPEDRLKAIKLFSEILGYITKPEPIKVENNVVNNHRVMVVKDHGSDDAWKRKLKDQQQKLTTQVDNSNVSAVKH